MQQEKKNGWRQWNATEKMLEKSFEHTKCWHHQLWSLHRIISEIRLAPKCLHNIHTGNKYHIKCNPEKAQTQSNIALNLSEENCIKIKSVRAR